MDDVVKVRSYISGPKWFGLKKILYAAAIEANIDITFTGEDSGILHTTIFFTLSGQRDDMKIFINALERWERNQ
jgi:hypothetical protein